MRVVVATFNRRSQNNHVLLDDVFVDDEFFRDHVWVRNSKRFERFKKGDNMTFTAEFKEYIDSSDINKNKLGLRRIRYVKFN